MFKIGEYLVYRKDVCLIKDIREKFYKETDYYVLAPLSDTSLTMQVPIDNDKIRCLITKKEIEQIIKRIPDINALSEFSTKDKTIEVEYKNLLSNGSHEDLIKIIKTTFLRNKERLDNNKKIADKDESFFKLAEQYLYNEFSVVLGMSFEETKDYVSDKVEALVK